MTCCVFGCIKVAFYQVGSRGYCGDHKAEAYEDAAADRKIDPTKSKRARHDYASNPMAGKHKDRAHSNL